jgi:hypothetical protein
MAFFGDPQHQFGAEVKRFRDCVYLHHQGMIFLVTIVVHIHRM